MQDGLPDVGKADHEGTPGLPTSAGGCWQSREDDSSGPAEGFRGVIVVMFLSFEVDTCSGQCRLPLRQRLLFGVTSRLQHSSHSECRSRQQLLFRRRQHHHVRHLMSPVQLHQVRQLMSPVQLHQVRQLMSPVQLHHVCQLIWLSKKDQYLLFS